MKRIKTDKDGYHEDNSKVNWQSVLNAGGEYKTDGGLWMRTVGKNHMGKAEHLVFEEH